MNSIPIIAIVCVCLGNLFYGVNMAYRDVPTFFNLTNNNLSSVTWAHAVNNRTLLTQALTSNVMMIEADVVIGNLVNGNTTNATNIPIMAHPPANSSDLSLQNFLTEILSSNEQVTSNSTRVRKGVKLDFKSMEAFENSIQSITALYNNMNYPVWINADIISGPLNAATTPLDPARFFAAARNFTNSTLSIGWTTNYGANFNATSYTGVQINNMLNTIASNSVNQSITFPVRAGIAAESLTQMQTLLTNVSGSTLTIWSSEGDPVNVTRLQELIKTVGVNKTYIDVPEDLEKQLDLSSFAGNSKMLSTVCQVFMAIAILFPLF